MRRATSRGVAHPGIIAVIVIIAVVAIGGFMLRGSTGGPSESRGQEIFEVARGDFDITIPASGDLAALRQIEIRNKLEGRAVITEIVEEGTIAKTGDVLVKLNDDEIVDEIDERLDQLDTADNNLINAKAVLAIRQETRDSELAKADLAITLAQLALKAWEEGEVVSKRKDLALTRKTAQKNFDRLKDLYDRSIELEESKYISTDEMRRDEIAMIEAKAQLEQTVLEAEIYEAYVHPQERATKESDLDQARDERLRVEQRWDAEVRSGESDLRSAEHKLASRKDQLEKAREQLEYCTIVAPSDGLVVYESSLGEGRRRGDGQPLQVGSEIYRNQMIMVLPDTSEMVAEVKVNEALSGLIEAGQPATVMPDAMPDAVLRSEVVSVGVLAESGGWRDPNRRDYTVRIKLNEGNDLGLKPSMRCRSEIAVGRVKDATYTPIQAIFREGPIAFVYTPEGSGFAPQPVTLGRASELFVEILDGLEPGQRVLLRKPDAREIIRSLEIPDTPAKTDFVASERRGGKPRGSGKAEGQPGQGHPQPQAADAKDDDDTESGEASTAAASTAEPAS